MSMASAPVMERPASIQVSKLVMGSFQVQWWMWRLQERASFAAQGALAGGAMRHDAAIRSASKTHHGYLPP
jgi:hypothetical protein